MNEKVQKAKDRLVVVYNNMFVLGDLTAFTWYGAGFLDGHSPFLNHDEMKELGKIFYDLVEKWKDFEKEKED